jgi:hypothetical protein
MRLSTYAKPRVVACAEDHPQHIGIPRGCLEDVRQELTNLGIRTVTRDEREQGRPLHVTFAGQPRPEQMAAAEAMVSHDTGVLAATTAFGKTGDRGLADRPASGEHPRSGSSRQLLDQWVDRLGWPLSWC